MPCSGGRRAWPPAACTCADLILLSLRLMLVWRLSIIRVFGLLTIPAVIRTAAQPFNSLLHMNCKPSVVICTAWLQLAFLLLLIASRSNTQQQSRAAGAGGVASTPQGRGLNNRRKRCRKALAALLGLIPSDSAHRLSSLTAVRGCAQTAQLAVSTSIIDDFDVGGGGLRGIAG